MPKPKPDESQNDFVSRCIPIVMNEGTAEDRDQAAAVCNSMWKQNQKKEEQTEHEKLLALVRARCEKQTAFNYGILTADRYVKTIGDMLGVQACYRHMSRTDGGGWASFEDVMQKAAGKLTYNNPEMLVKAKREEVSLPDGLERPKNTLMIFRHVLTTSTKDRDGDILRTKGAEIDPKMLMLYQHIHTLPIGKMLAKALHTKDSLELYSCIVDMNELCHDCAVMIDNDMGRFSHGFRALDFLEIKAGDRESPGGYDVKRFEILEESLVSVPANPDTETQEIILSLVDKGKLTSGLMKDYSVGFRERMPMRVPVELDVKLLVNGQEVKSDADQCRNEAGGKGIDSGASEETEDVSNEGKGKEEKGTENEDVNLLEEKELVGTEQGEKKQLVDDDESGGSEAVPPKPDQDSEAKMVCPECDYVGPGKAGKCPECGAKLVPEKPRKKPEKPEKPEKGHVLEKLGRVLNKANESKIRDAVDDLDEAKKMDGVSRGCKALIGQASRGLKDVLSSLGLEQGIAKEFGVKDAMAVVLAEGDEQELSVLKSALEALDEGDRRDDVVRQFAELSI